MINKIELHQEVVEELKKTFNIKYKIDCREFDINPKILIDSLKQFSGKAFGPKDKILLVHMDTDYYDPLLPCGLIPINTIRIFCNLDIPLHAILFVTNHFNIKKEFDFLLKDHHEKDRPCIIETLLSPMLFDPSEYKTTDEVNFNFNQIEKQGLCMMAKPRSHRVAFWNFLLENKLLEKIAVSQNFNE